MCVGNMGAIPCQQILSTVHDGNSYMVGRPAGIGGLRFANPPYRASADVAWNRLLGLRLYLTAFPPIAFIAERSEIFQHCLAALNKRYYVVNVQ